MALFPDRWSWRLDLAEDLDDLLTRQPLFEMSLVEAGADAGWPPRDRLHLWTYVQIWRCPHATALTLRGGSGHGRGTPYFAGRFGRVEPRRAAAVS